MMNLPLNFSAPTGQVQNNYAQPTRTNPYLTSSQYSDMQLHTPSGMYFQGGKFYEPYTVGTKQVQTSSGNNYNPFGTSFGNSGYGGIGGSGSYSGFGWGYNQPTYATVPDILEGSVQSGDQYFKPFTGNATGIINGDLSMASMAGQAQQYQPQGIPNSLLNFLSAPNMQQTNNQQNSGAGRFSGLLGSPIVTTNTQGK
jgi:hypothetical protein